jgi:PKHD-type hydroxylase
MKQYYVRKILEKDQISEITDTIQNANQNDSWIDGLLSNRGVTKQVKNNLELSDVNSVQLINEYIMHSLDNDKEFLNFTIPTTTYLNIVSKTQSGGYYKPHKDTWSNGDYSTTVFLNSPEEYGGGELCLYLGGEEEIKIKLDAGWGITYSTGILHRVNKVSFGNRYVSVFWTKSAIKDSFMRHIYSEISNVYDYLKKQNISIHTSDCIGADKDPLFSIDSLKNEILRKYSLQ